MICEYGSLKLREEASSGKIFAPKDCLQLLETFVPALQVSHDSISRYFFVWSEIFQQPALFRIVRAAEEFFRKATPFDAVYKFMYLHRKCKGISHKIKFCMEATIDAIANKIIRKEDFSIPSIRSQNNRGLVDRQLLLWQYLQDLTTGPLLGSCEFSPKEIQHIQWALTLPNYRRWTGEVVFDVNEILGLVDAATSSCSHEPLRSSHRANKYIKFVGDVVFNNRFENAVSIALRWNFNTESFIKHKAVKWAWDLATESEACSEPNMPAPISPVVCVEAGLGIQDGAQLVEGSLQLSFNGWPPWLPLEALTMDDDMLRCIMLSCMHVRGRGDAWSGKDK